MRGKGLERRPADARPIRQIAITDAALRRRAPLSGQPTMKTIVAVGNGANRHLLGQPPLVRACMRPDGFSSENIWIGADCEGALAQFIKVPVSEVFPITCDWSDAELANLPCDPGTTENTINRAGVHTGMRGLVAGVYGGVGSTAVPLAKRRGRYVICITTAAKMGDVRAAAADEVIENGRNPMALLGRDSVDVVVDNLAGAGFGAMLGRHVTMRRASCAMPGAWFRLGYIVRYSRRSSRVRYDPPAGSRARQSSASGFLLRRW
jgi:hypothetical protein